MKKEELFYDSRDGMSRIHAVRWLPEAEEIPDGKPVAIVQIIHGMAEYAERYEEFARFLTERGFVVTGDDHLGHGKSVTDGCYGYFCRQDPATVVVRDVHRLKKLTQELYPGVPYFIVGHSMGSFILRNYICRYGSGIRGAVIMGTGMQSGATVKAAKAVAAVQELFCGGRHVSRLLDWLAFGSYNRRFAPARTPSDWLSRNEANVDAYLADPLCGFTFTVNGFQTLFELIDRIRRPENLERIPSELPIYMVSGADDPVGDYGEGVKRAYRSLRQVGIRDLTMKLYDKDRHELLNEIDRDQVMKDIYLWIMSRKGKYE